MPNTQLDSLSCTLPKHGSAEDLTNYLVVDLPSHPSDETPRITNYAPRSPTSSEVHSERSSPNYSIQGSQHEALDSKSAETDDEVILALETLLLNTSKWNSSQHFIPAGISQRMLRPPALIQEGLEWSQQGLWMLPKWTVEPPTEAVETVATEALRRQ